MGEGEGRGESPSEESHSAVEVPAIVRGSRVPAEAAGRVPAEAAGKVPASKKGCSSTVQADLTRGKQEREGSPKTEKYEREGRRQGHDFSNADRTDRATQERVQYQRVGPPGQLLYR